MRIRSLSLFGILGLAALGPWSAPARADVSVLCQNIQGGAAGAGGLLGCTQQQGNSATNENILFSDPAAVTSDPSLPVPSTVIGVTQKTNTLFSFTSTTDNLLVNNGQGGFSTITSTTDSYINNLSYYVSPSQAYGSTFNAFTALDTNLDVGQNTSGLVQFIVQAMTSLGVAETFTTEMFALTAGANNFTFLAANGEVITKVTYSATNVSDVMVEDVKQTSVNLANTPVVSVPEPFSLALLGGGLIVFGCFPHRRPVARKG